MRFPKIDYSRILLPAIFGVSSYTIAQTLFPQHSFQKKFLKGDNISKLEFARRTAKMILNDPALKVALVAIFATVSVQSF